MIPCEKRINNKPDFLMKILKKDVNYCETIKLKKKDNLTPLICQQLQLTQIPGVSVKIAEKITESMVLLKI